jgi:hypothetical protein
VDGVSIRRAWIEPMSWAAPSLLGDQMPIERDSNIAAIPQLQSSMLGTARRIFKKNILDAHINFLLSFADLGNHFELKYMPILL